MMFAFLQLSFLERCSVAFVYIVFLYVNPTLLSRHKLSHELVKIAQEAFNLELVHDG